MICPCRQDPKAPAANTRRATSRPQPAHSRARAHGRVAEHRQHHLPPTPQEGDGTAVSAADEILRKMHDVAHLCCKHTYFAPQQKRPATIRPLTCGFVWCQQRDSNPQPSAYKAAALPLELCWHRRGAQCSTGARAHGLPRGHDARRHCMLLGYREARARELPSDHGTCLRNAPLKHLETWARGLPGGHGNLRHSAPLARATPLPGSSRRWGPGRRCRPPRRTRRPRRRRQNRGRPLCR